MIFASVMQPAHCCQQKTLPEAVPTLSSCQWTSELPYCTDCTTKPVQISQKLLALERPLTHECLSVIIFPAYNCTLSPSICTKLRVTVFFETQCYVTHLISRVTP